MMTALTVEIDQMLQIEHAIETAGTWRICPCFVQPNARLQETIQLCALLFELRLRCAPAPTAAPAVRADPI
jgi:hypothetical protein